MNNSQDIKKNNGTNLILDDEIDFFELYKSIRRRWKFVAGSSIVGITIALFNIFTAKPLYEGEFRIVLEDNESGGLSSLISQSTGLEDLQLGSVLNSKNSIQTEIEILYSSSVLKPVFENLKKQKNSDKFNNTLFKNWVRKAINVEAKRKTTILTVKLKDNQKSVIFPTTKLISEKYQEYSNEGRQKELDNLINYLDDQVRIYKPIAQQSALMATEFGLKNNLTFQDGLPISLGNQINSSEFGEAGNQKDSEEDSTRVPLRGNIETVRSEVNRRIITLEKQLIQAKNQDIANHYLFESLPKRKPIESYRSKLADIELEILQKSTIYKSNDPTLKELKRKKEDLVSYLNRELILLIEGELKLYGSKLKATDVSPEILNKHKELTQKSLRDATFLSDFENKLQTLKFEKARSPLPWRLISDITVSENPVSPRKKRMLAYGLLTGFLAGLIIALYIDQKTKLVFSEKELIKIFGKEPLYKFSINQKDNWEEYLNLITRKYLVQTSKLGLVPLGKINDDWMKNLYEEFKKLINPKNIICDRNLFKSSECDVIFIITQKGVNKRTELRNFIKKLEIQGNKTVEWFILDNENSL